MSSFKEEILKEIEQRERRRKPRKLKNKIMQTLEKELDANLKQLKNYACHKVDIEELGLEAEIFVDLAKQMGFEVTKITENTYFLFVIDAYNASIAGTRIQEHRKQLEEAMKVCKRKLLEEFERIKEEITKKRFEDKREDDHLVIFVKSSYNIVTRYENLIIGEFFSLLDLEFLGQREDGAWKFKI